MKINKSTIKRANIYFLGNILNKAIPFLLLPIMTRLLSTDQYGELSIYTASVVLLTSIIGLCGNTVIGQRFFKTNDKKSLIRTSFNIINYGFVVLLVLFAITFPFLFNIINISKWLIIVAILNAYFTMYFAVTKSILQLTEKSFLFSVSQLAITLINFSLSILLVYKFSWKGRIVAIVISSIVGFVFSIIYFRKNGISFISIVKQKKDLKSNAILGFHLLPTTVGSWLYTLGDRFLLAFLLDKASVGIYSAIFSLSAIIEVIGQSLSLVWGPYFFKSMASGQKEKKIKGLTLIICLGLFTTSILASLVLPFFAKFYFGRDFVTGLSMIPYIIIGYSFISINSFISYYFLHYEKNRLLSLSFIISAILRLLLSYILIQINGLIGAAQGVLVSGVLSTCIMILLFINSKKRKELL